MILEPLAHAMRHRALELEVEAHLLEALADIDDVAIDLCALDAGTSGFGTIQPVEPIPA